MSFLENLFGRPSITSTINREAPAPREAINQVSDYLALATHDGSGKRLHEKQVNRTLRLLDRL